MFTRGSREASNFVNIYNFFYVDCKSAFKKQVRLTVYRRALGVLSGRETHLAGAGARVTYGGMTPSDIPSQSERGDSFAGVMYEPSEAPVTYVNFS